MDQDRKEQTPAQMIEAELLAQLDMLREAAKRGELRCIVWGIEPHKTPGRAILDYRGDSEMTEIVCRKIHQRVVERVRRTDPDIAAAIAATAPQHPAGRLS